MPQTVAHPDAAAAAVPPVWYFDFVSPFAYLQFEWLRRERPEFTFKPKPVLLAGLLGHWGSVGPAEIAPKRAFTYRFVQWQARHLDIPMRFPPSHPFNPLAALRLVIAAGGSADAVSAIFRHIWRAGRAGDSAEALASLASRLGVDIHAATADPSVKRQLAGNGEDAIAAGVFGVPTFLVDGRLFWGFDATSMLFDYLDDPAAFEDAAMRALIDLPVGIERSR